MGSDGLAGQVSNTTPTARLARLQDSPEGAEQNTNTPTFMAHVAIFSVTQFLYKAEIQD